MARYILIDNHSGLIFADTGDLNGAARDETPIEAAARFDRESHYTNTSYEDVPRATMHANAIGFHVYRADIDGSEAVPLVVNGEDEATIQEVESRCRYVASLRRFCND